MVQESTYLKSETDLRDKLDELYAEAKKAIESGEPPRFKNLLEIAKAEVTIVTAIHKITENTSIPPICTFITSGPTFRWIR